MASNVDLYRKLCEYIPAEAAELIAEGFSHTADLASSDDLQAVMSEVRAARTDLHATRADLDQLEYRLLAAVHEAKADMFRWTLTFFASLWVAIAGAVVAIVIGG